MPDLARLAAAARALLPLGAGVAATDPRVDHPAFPDEEISAIPARLREFRAGRAAARAAMAAIGLPPVALPMRPDRAPDWPPGLALSITHSATACLAAVLQGPRGLGIDIEPDTPLPPDVWESVLSPAERLSHGKEALAVFAAKEAAYKAQYPVSSTLFGFDALEVALTPGHFTATFRQSVPGFAAGARLQGHWARAEGHLMATVLIP